MRAIVIKQSLRNNDALQSFVDNGKTREYTHALEGKDLVTIIESNIDCDDGPRMALVIAAGLVDNKFYAHIVDNERMFVVFPYTVVEIKRGDEKAEQVAQSVGALFSIPPTQMQFLKMFDFDHPDSPENL